MKIAALNNINNVYTDKCISNLDEALKHDERDTLKCRALKLKCLLYSYQYEEYLKELKKFYDEKNRRIDSTCGMLHFGILIVWNKNPKTNQLNHTKS